MWGWGDGGGMGCTPLSLDGFLWGKSHRSKWMMTGGSPMTQESSICYDGVMMGMSWIWAWL